MNGETEIEIDPDEGVALVQKWMDAREKGWTYSGTPEEFELLAKFAGYLIVQNGRKSETLEDFSNTGKMLIDLISAYRKIIKENNFTVPQEVSEIEVQIVQAAARRLLRC